MKNRYQNLQLLLTPHIIKALNISTRGVNVFESINFLLIESRILLIVQSLQSVVTQSNQNCGTPHCISSTTEESWAQSIAISHSASIFKDTYSLNLQLI